MRLRLHAQQVPGAVDGDCLLPSNPVLKAYSWRSPAQHNHALSKPARTDVLVLLQSGLTENPHALPHAADYPVPYGDEV